MQKGEFSKTMRIDLIPEAPAEPVAGKRKRIVMARAAEPFTSPGRPVIVGDGESKYQELLQSLYDAALVADFSGRIVDVNMRALEFLQYERQELLGLTMPQVISGADESLIQTLCQNLENERFTLIQAYCIRRDGTFFPSEIAVNRLILGKLHLCFFVRDITVRKQAEEMLMTEHNALQNAGNGIAVADMGGMMEYVNPAMGRMWKQNPDAMIGQPVRTLMRNPSAVDRLLEDTIRRSRPFTEEMVARRADGSDFSVQVAGSCNRNTDGEPLGAVLSFVDITDRTRAEEAVREAERHRVMLESLGAACHYLSQPATVLLGNLEILQGVDAIENSALRQVVDSSIEAMRKIGAILHKLNRVNQYKTTPYLQSSTGSRLDESRILEI